MREVDKMYREARHPVCSARFAGGKKNYVNNVETVFADCAFELLL